MQGSSQHSSCVCALQVAQPAALQAHAHTTAPPNIFADSPDCLDDLDIDQLVSSHRQQAAKQQPAQHTAPGVHAACSITQANQRLPLRKPSSHSLSLLGGSGSGAQPLAGPATAAAQLPAARPALADVLHASAAPRASVLIAEAVARASASPVQPAAQAGQTGPRAARCSHGVPMHQCRHKQDHLNQVNADLVKILLGERAAQPGEQDRLKAMKKTIEESMERDSKGGPQGFAQHSDAPAAAALDTNALGDHRQQSLLPCHGGAQGVHSPPPLSMHKNFVIRSSLLP